VLPALDAIEGFSPHSRHQPLLRTRVDVTLPDGAEAQAWVYFYNAPLGRARRILSGDYLEHIKRVSPSRAQGAPSMPTSSGCPFDELSVPRAAGSPFASTIGVFFGFGNRRAEKPPASVISRGTEPVLQSSAGSLR
jgi:hypothetical protein